MDKIYTHMGWESNFTNKQDDRISWNWITVATGCINTWNLTAHIHLNVWVAIITPSDLNKKVLRDFELILLNWGDEEFYKALISEYDNICTLSEEDNIFVLKNRKDLVREWKAAYLPWAVVGFNHKQMAEEIMEIVKIRDCDDTWFLSKYDDSKQIAKEQFWWKALFGKWSKNKFRDTGKKYKSK